MPYDIAEDSLHTAVFTVNLTLTFERKVARTESSDR